MYICSAVFYWNFYGANMFFYTEETKGVFFLLKHSVDAAQRDYQKDFGE